jgi:hypothetical protein
MKIKAFAILGIALLLTSKGLANTFVGNGGNAGDLELQMTLGEIERTASAIKDDTNTEAFCTCPQDYKGRAICEPLQEMDNEQKNYCQKTLKTKAEEILKLLSPQGGVKWDFTIEEMSTQENAGIRDADAVANSENFRITMERDPFISKKPPERMFLITHELLHLTKYEGHFIKDDVPTGPYKDREGGRKLLNAYGSAFAMYAHVHNIYSVLRGSQRRSKNYVNNWFSLNIGTNTGERNSTFSQNDVMGATLEYRRQFTSPWGIFFRAGSFGAEKSDVVSTTKVTVDKSSFALGVSRQVLLFRDPLTYWGQSYLLLGAGLEYQKIKYKLDDGFVTVEDSATSTAALVRTQYYIPFIWGGWAFAEISATNHNYNLDKVNVKSTPIQGQIYAGVSYGF